MRIAMLVLVLCALAAPLALADGPSSDTGRPVEFTAPIVAVEAGDRITVRHDGRTETIRLSDIICPQPGQPFADQAREFAARLASGQQATLTVFRRDPFGQTVALVTLADGTVLNHELVKAGLAWWQRNYSTDPETERLEAEARVARRGLWADPKPVPPWEFKPR